MKHCPNCGRIIDVSTRITGDTIWCPCGALLRVRHAAGGTELTATLPLAALSAPIPETAAKARARRRKGGQR